jgi:hypothetical protein
MLCLKIVKIVLQILYWQWQEKLRKYISLLNYRKGNIRMD